MWCIKDNNYVVICLVLGVLFKSACCAPNLPTGAISSGEQVLVITTMPTDSSDVTVTPSSSRESWEEDNNDLGLRRDEKPASIPHKSVPIMVKSKVCH